jgi:hypothetical protein
MVSFTLATLPPGCCLQTHWVGDWIGSTACWWGIEEENPILIRSQTPFLQYIASHLTDRATPSYTVYCSKFQNNIHLGPPFCINLHINEIFMFSKRIVSCGSSLTLVTELQGGWLGFDSWQRQKFFSLHHCVQTGFGTHPASYQVGTVTCLWDRVARAWSYHLPPSSAEVKNTSTYTSSPPYIFTAWCLIKHNVCLYDVCILSSLYSRIMNMYVKHSSALSSLYCIHLFCTQ